MEKNSFLKHFAVIGTGSILNILLGLLTTPIITRIVDPIEYGQLSIFTMYSGIAVMVLCLGLDQAMVRYYYEKKEVEYKRALLFRCIKLPILISCILSIIVIALSGFHIVQLEFDTFIITLLCIYTLIQIVYRFSLLLVRLSYKSKLYSALNVIHKLSYIGIVLPLIFLIQKNYLSLLIIATILSALICMFISIFAQAKLWNISLNKEQECEVSNRELIRYGYPYIISMGVTMIFQAIDKIALNTYCTYAEVGIYSSTMTLVNVFAVIQSTFNTLWAPMAVEHYTNDKEDRRFYQQGNQIITVIMFFLGVSLILCKDVFAVLLGEKYREAAYILPFLIFNPIMYTISETTVSGLVFMKKSKLQIVVAVGACLTNIIGNTILVPRLGCQGAAISTGISYIVFFTLRTLLSNKYFYVKYHLGKFYLLTAVVAAYAMYNTFIRFNLMSAAGYIMCVCVMIVLYKNVVIWIWKYCLNVVKGFGKNSN